MWIISGLQDGPRLVAFYIVEHPRLWFEERILEIRNAFNRSQPTEFDPQISEQLFKGLFPVPFAQYVINSAKSIIFVPDDILFLLPLEALSPTASKSQYPLLKIPTSYFPSAAAFAPVARRLFEPNGEWTAQFIGVADPVISKGRRTVHVGEHSVEEVGVFDPTTCRKGKPTTGASAVVSRQSQD